MCHWLGSVDMGSQGVIFNLGSAQVYSPAIMDTCFSYEKDIRIVVTDYFMYIYLIVLFLIVALLLLINFTAFVIFSSLIDAVILLLNCCGLILAFAYNFSLLDIIFS